MSSPLDHSFRSVANPPGLSPWTLQPTNDGSFTFFSEEYGEAFHGREGAKAEAFEKFAQATGLAQKAQQDHVRLLDVFAMAWATTRQQR